MDGARRRGWVAEERWHGGRGMLAELQGVVSVRMVRDDTVAG